MLSITEVEQQSGISAFTLRYYDKCGFFPNVRRDSRNRRQYDDADVARLELIEALRLSGLSIEGIRGFLQNFDDEQFLTVKQIIEFQSLRIGLLQEQMEHAKEILDTLAKEIGETYPSATESKDEQPDD